VACYAFFNSYYQGVITGFASVCGPISIQTYGFGTGIAGFGSNVIAIIFYFIFEITGGENLVKDLESQMISYIIVLPIIFVFYIITLFIFLRKYGHYVNMLDEEFKKKEEQLLQTNEDITRTDQSVKTINTFTSWKTTGTERKYSAFSVLKRIIDMWLAMIFTYAITIQMITFVLPNLADKYDGNGEIYILMYIFIYNFGDTIGKMLPSKWHFRNTFVVHGVTFGRFLFQIYFTVLIYTTPHKFFSHFVLRGLIFSVIGLSNGFLTNNFFVVAINRFRNIKNTDYAGYLMVFGLIIGIACGTFTGVLWGL
jgi:hypothetical protein